MTMILWVVILTALAGVGGTGLGGVAGALMQRDSKRVVSLLLSFAGGVMLAVVCFDLIPGAVHPENAPKNMNLLWVLAGILFGFVVVYLLNHCIDRSTNHEVAHIDADHPKTADDLDELIHSDHLMAHREEGNHLFTAGVVMAAAIALHNLPEGMVIGASFASSAASANVFSGSGLLMAIIIGLHNIPEGMAVVVPLVSGGMKKGSAVLITAASGAPTIIGALLGYWIGGVGPLGLCLSLSCASGAMLYVVLGELLPEAILMWRSKLPAFATAGGILLGLLLMYV
ncbi:MAG: ZIP family metal transporter [Angelakisella sp.]|nr:ZIP family metal transporter [Angelakisella sp.]